MGMQRDMVYLEGKRGEGAQKNIDSIFLYANRCLIAEVPAQKVI